MLKSCKLAALALAMGLCLSATAQAQSPDCGLAAQALAAIKSVGQGINNLGAPVFNQGRRNPTCEKYNTALAALGAADPSANACDSLPPSVKALPQLVQACANGLTVGQVQQALAGGTLKTQCQASRVGKYSSLISQLAGQNFASKQALLDFISSQCPGLI